MKIIELKKGETIPYELLELADPSRERIETYITKSKLFVGLLSGEKEILAVLAVVKLNDICCEIMNVAVDEKVRGSGYGKQILGHAITYAKESGFKKIRIATGNSSIGQLVLYQKLGFEMQSIERNYFVRNYEEELWENDIQCKHKIVLEKNLE